MSYDFSIHFMKQNMKFVTIFLYRDRLVCNPLPYLSWIAKTPLGFTIIPCHQPVPRPVWSDNGNTAASCFWRKFAFCTSKGERAVSIRRQKELIKQSSTSHPIAWLKRTLKMKVSYSRPQKTKSLKEEMREEDLLVRRQTESEDCWKRFCCTWEFVSHTEES